MEKMKVQYLKIRVALHRSGEFAMWQVNLINLPATVTGKHIILTNTFHEKVIPIVRRIVGLHGEHKLKS